MYVYSTLIAILVCPDKMERKHNIMPNSIIHKVHTYINK